jgi:hypothetical protein
LIKERFEKKSDVIWRKIGDEIVVLIDDGLSTHVLNRTAAYIWELCDGQLRVQDIADNLCKRFDIDKNQATKDIEELLPKLTRIGILQQVTEAN